MHRNFWLHDWFHVWEQYPRDRVLVWKRVTLLEG